ncbi:MAG TPA: wax ester/triacylglycerol synthase family O-acyltransferase [Actinomycetales bacterium]|nr:wax ester/triacylglycerol synthase family O-acyltransferase [Actinomycetales bacterium]
MPDRLSLLDASFLYLEEPTTAMHVGSMAVFEPPAEGFDYDRLVTLVAARIAYVPRYRQRVRVVPGRLANPVWVDDEDFDVTYHVRRSALPRPGSQEQLLELVARVQSRPLDRSRPLWEVYLVEGLEDGRFAIVTKSHQALVDGVNAVDIGQVILDDSPETPEVPTDTWKPSKEPSDLELLAGALADVVRSPGDVVDSVRGGLVDVRATAGRVLGQLGHLASTAARTAARPAPTSPLNAEIGEQRRYAVAATSLEDHRAVRARHSRRGSELSVNDVVLATVAGALRTWLLTRGEPVVPATVVRALVPVSVHDPDDDPLTSDDSDEPARGALHGGGHRTGNQVAAFVVDLPVGEPNPAVRLHQIAYSMRAHAEAGRAVGAQALVGIAGFAPPTLHSLGARVASAVSRRLFNLVVTNVPGPQHPLYAGGARMLASYPVMPLAKGQAVSIGLTSYDGGVYYGVNGDRDAMPDVDVLAGCLVDSLTELRETARSRAPRRATT